MGKPKNRVWNTIVPGPLEQYAPGYRPWLLGRGYALVTTASQLQLMAHVSRWLEREGLSAAALAGPEPARFLAARQAAGTRKPETVAACARCWITWASSGSSRRGRRKRRGARQPS